MWKFFTILVWILPIIKISCAEELISSSLRRFIEPIPENSICNGVNDGADTQGVCMDRNACWLSGGKIIGSCPTSKSCCYYERMCSSTSAFKLSYFVNPPKPHQHCAYEVEVSNSNVCQIRLDFETFELAQPTASDVPCYGAFCDRKEAAKCHNDKFTLLSGFGGSSALGISNLCGFNSGQHMYVPVNASQGIKSVTLSFHLEDRDQDNTLIEPRWKIRVTQLECAPQQYGYFAQRNSVPSYTDYNRLAPPGCLQYYTDRSAIYRSFNFNSEDESKRRYIANTHYAICFRRTPDACGIKHTAESFEVGSYYVQGGSETDHQCDSYSLSDYLFIPNGFSSERKEADKYCGTSLSTNSSVIAKSPGPFYVIFRSDNVILNDFPDSERGFRIKYQILNNC